MCMPQHVYGSQRTNCRSQFSPSVMILEVEHELKLSAFVGGAFNYNIITGFLPSLSSLQVHPYTPPYFPSNLWPHFFIK